ncbi:MAG: acyltransferase [Muribaculaceae bacterium]|nr:acyltransferase [Muribaculaceae bacterium]
MDVVRYYLATCVIIAHLNALTGFDFYWPTPGSIRVGAFFTISGFLVYPSFFRKNNLGQYFRSRVVRIMPPYIVVILLFSLLLVFASTLAPQQYFLSADYWKYLLANLSYLNFLQPDLPGVFTEEQFNSSAVNGSLWTMKIEWLMYLSVPIIALIHRRFQNKFNLIFALLIGGSIAYRLVMYYLYVESGNEMYRILDRQFFGQASYFYFGAYLYFIKDKLIKYKWLFLSVALFLWAIGSYIPLYHFTLKPLVVSLVTIWVCIVGNWGKYISRHDNVSYDLYLYHFPVIQLGIYCGMLEWQPWLILLYVFGVTTTCAILSWNLVGKRCKRLLS